MDLFLQSVGPAVARGGGKGFARPAAREDAFASRAGSPLQVPQSPAQLFLDKPLSPLAAAASTFPSPWHCLALTLRSFFPSPAGCWEVQWAVAAPAAKLGEERGPGRARAAAGDARFCEFCRWGAKARCGRGGG